MSLEYEIVGYIYCKYHLLCDWSFNSLVVSSVDLLPKGSQMPASFNRMLVQVPSISTSYPAFCFCILGGDKMAEGLGPLSLEWDSGLMGSA